MPFDRLALQKTFSSQPLIKQSGGTLICPAKINDAIFVSSLVESFEITRINELN